MESKYLKTAMILVLASFMLVSLVFGIVVLVVRGPSFFGHSAKTSACTQDRAASLAADLIKNSSTFKYDGISGSVKQVSIDSPDNGQTWNTQFSFQTAHPGHGDRSGQALADVITSHLAQVTLSNCKIVSAICDKSWDLLSDKGIPAH